MRKLIANFIILFFGLLGIFSNNAKAGFYNNDKRECPILFKMGKWQKHDNLDHREYWGRRQSWFNVMDGFIQESGDSFNFNPKSEKSYNINDTNNPAVLVYIGPWQKVTLTKGFLWNKEETEVEIRMIASQRGTHLENHYETKDELNAKIPEQSFVLLEEPNDLIVKCDILRAQKFGYNAVFDFYINIFRAYLGKSILAGSGKIIDSETGEIIADEKGILVK